MESLAYGLSAMNTPEGVEIGGNTYPNRHRLKALGGVWQKEKKVWLLPVSADLTSLQPRRQKVFRTWICGKKVAKIDPWNPQGPMIWVCSCCPTYKSDYDGT